MKKLIYIGCIAALLICCNTARRTANKTTEEVILKEQDTVRIANDELEYEIIIIEPGFNAWLLSRAHPRNYYGQNYLETRNKVLTTEWNARVLQPNQFNPNLYEWQINYDPNINYGYEVNYLLYNYFLYFQIKYKQRLSYFVPRI